VVYYEQQRPDDREKPPGCLDVILITRAVFGVLLWPLSVMFVVILDLGVTFYLYATQPLLALIPVAITAAAICGFTLWERHRYRLKDE
jgi:hypothetical protein